MIRKLLFTFATYFIISASIAQENNKLQADTLFYRTQNLQKESKLKHPKVTSINPTSASISYPIFSNQDKINKFVQAEIANIISVKNSNDLNIEKSLTNFIEDFEVSIQKQKNIPTDWQLKLHTKVIRQTKEYICLAHEYYSYTGGAHGIYAIYYSTYDLKNEKKLALEDLLIPDCQTELAAIGEELFREKEEISTSQSLEKDFFFEQGKFSLPENFTITPNGIKFLYNVYEIKPYAAGITTLTIPFDKLKKIIKSDKFLANFVN